LSFVKFHQIMQNWRSTLIASFTIVQKESEMI